MTISEHDIIKWMTVGGRVQVPPHLAALEFNSVEEAGSEFATHLESQREAIWHMADVIAAGTLQAVLACDGDSASVRRATADSLRHFAGLYGDRDIETIRRYLKIGLVYPETANGDLVRVTTKPINLYLSALGALAYDDDPVQWVTRAIDNDWSVSELTQRIRAAHSDGPVQIVTMRNLYDYTLPGDGVIPVAYITPPVAAAIEAAVRRPAQIPPLDADAYTAAAIATQVIESIYLALKNPGAKSNGKIESFDVKVVARYSKPNTPIVA